MLVRVDIENKEGLTLLTYRSSSVKIYNDTPLYSVSQKKHGITFKGYFLSARDEEMAISVLDSLIRDLSLDGDALIFKKHATIYAYIDNYLTNRNSAFPVPRKRSSSDPKKIILNKKKVYIDVADTVVQRSTSGRCHTTAYGEITARPTEDVGCMSLKIDSRSLCSMKTMRFDPSVSAKREGITTFLTLPSKDVQIMSYAFECNDASLPIIRVVLVDSKTLEISICCDSDLIPEMVTSTVVFDFHPGNLSVECKKGTYEYHHAQRSLVWSVSPGEMSTITLHCTEPHRSAVSLRYSYEFSQTALSSVIVNSLSSEADENWIRHTTGVFGLLRALE